MTKELIWGVLVLALILTAYLSHVEDRRHKEALARLEARKLEVQTHIRELDKQIEIGEQRMADSDREFKTKLAELDEERIREIDAKLAAASKTEEVTADGHATNTRVERGNR